MQQVFSDLRLDQFGAADVQHGRCIAWLLVDLVNDAVSDGHEITSGWPSVTGCSEWMGYTELKSVIPSIFQGVFPFGEDGHA